MRKNFGKIEKIIEALNSMETIIKNSISIDVMKNDFMLSVEKINEALKGITVELKLENKHIQWENLEEFCITLLEKEYVFEEFVEFFEEYSPMLKGKLIVLKNKLNMSC